MLADNFFFRIALDALSPGVPACNYAVWVKHKDRVIGYPSYQQTKLTLAFTYGIERSAPFGNVAGDFGKPLQDTCFAADGINHY